MFSMCVFFWNHKTSPQVLDNCSAGIRLETTFDPLSGDQHKDIHAMLPWGPGVDVGAQAATKAKQEAMAHAAEASKNAAAAVEAGGYTAGSSNSTSRRMSGDQPHWLGDAQDAHEDGSYHASSSSSSSASVPAIPAWLYSVTSALGPNVFGKDRARAVGGARNLAHRLSGGPLGTPHGVLGISGFTTGPLGRPLRIQRGSASAWGIPVERLKNTVAAATAAAEDGAADDLQGRASVISSPTRGRQNTLQERKNKLKSSAAAAAARKQQLPLPSALVQWDGALGWESGGGDCNAALAFFVPPVVQPEPRVVVAAQAPSRDMGPRVSRIVGSFQDVMFLVAAVKHFIGPEMELDENLTSPIVSNYYCDSGSSSTGATEVGRIPSGATGEELPVASGHGHPWTKSSCGSKPEPLQNMSAESEHHEDGQDGGGDSSWQSPFRSDYSTKNGPMIQSTASRALNPASSTVGGAGEHKGEMNDGAAEVNEAISASIAPASPNRDRTMSELLRSVEQTRKHHIKSDDQGSDNGKDDEGNEDNAGDALEDARSTSSTIEEYDFENDRDDDDDDEKGHRLVNDGAHVTTSEDGDNSSEESSELELESALDAAQQAASLSVRIRIVGLECMLLDDW